LKEELINSSYSRRIYSAGGRRAERFTIPKKGFVFDNLKFTLRTFYIDCAWKGNHRIGKTGDHSHDLETEIYFILYNKFMQIRHQVVHILADQWTNPNVTRPLKPIAMIKIDVSKRIRFRRIDQCGHKHV
jgi:hypothetical protein